MRTLCGDVFRRGGGVAFNHSRGRAVGRGLRALTHLCAPWGDLDVFFVRCLSSLVSLQALARDDDS